MALEIHNLKNPKVDQVMIVFTLDSVSEKGQFPFAVSLPEDPSYSESAGYSVQKHAGRALVSIFEIDGDVQKIKNKMIADVEGVIDVSGVEISGQTHVFNMCLGDNKELVGVLKTKAKIQEIIEVPRSE
jgi:hypothetical protein